MASLEQRPNRKAYIMAMARVLDFALVTMFEVAFQMRQEAVLGFQTVTPKSHNGALEQPSH